MKVSVQVGGEFILSEEDLQHPVLFIAGGIGITPIASMVAHYADRAGTPSSKGALHQIVSLPV